MSTEESETQTNITTKPSTKQKITLKSRSSSSKSLELLSKEFDASNLSKYTHPINKYQVRPKIWELPNRKNFNNWVIDTFQQYNTSKPNIQNKYLENPLIKEQLRLSNIQRLTRDYLQGESPSRGLLLYIGLGHGKTCAAITISEAILTKKKVIVISKANLEDNFRKEIRSCGSEYAKTAHHWVFSKCDTESEKQLAKDIGIPTSSITENGGAYFVDFTKTTSNYNNLTSQQRTKLDIQIEHIVEKRFEFIHFDNPRIWINLKDGDLDDKIVIVDEVHNIGNIMTSQTSSSAEKYYNLFMNAKNPKYIFLSGTPIVNQVFEVSKIYNILRGYMDIVNVKFKNTYDTPVNYDKITYLLKNNKHVDQIIINTTQRNIRVTMNPKNFVTHPDGKGIIYKPDESIEFSVFKTEVTNIIQTIGYKITVSIERKTCFETDKIEFEKMFYNPETNKLKNTDLIKRRIVGLTSYYEYPDKSTYPELLSINKVQIPMSEYQFNSYEVYRHQEIQKDSTNKKRQDTDMKMQQSSYRIKSRLACSFVFPEEIGSPYDLKVFEDKIELDEKLANMLNNFEISTSDYELMVHKDIDKHIKQKYLQLLERDKSKYLDIKNGSLAKYSPKYFIMIQNINKEKGKLLVYSYFRNLIGLNIFSYALIQSGKWSQFRIKKTNSKGGKANKHYTEWELDENDEEKGKSKFIFYTGVESKEERDIYRNIYNSDWDKLPQTCNKLINQLKLINANNYYGEVIKMIMTTRTGAEGLDLKEVRYIHIMEPYWQPVLIDQIIGRGVRNGSHLRLNPIDRNVEVYIYMSTIIPSLIRKSQYIDVRNDVYKYSNPVLTDKANKVVSSDEYLYLIAERKRIIINEFQKLMKESAFDCSLNYAENSHNPINKGMVCMDYPTKKNRDDYLFTPDIDDTINTIDISQEKILIETFKSFMYKSKIFYYNSIPSGDGKLYIYNENPAKSIRLPNRIGRVKVIKGKTTFEFFSKTITSKKTQKEKEKEKKKKEKEKKTKRRV